MSEIAVVTGAGSGVGRAVVIDLARRGYRVALLGRRKQQLDETVALAAAAAGSLLPIACDVSDEQQVRAMPDQVRSEFGDPTVLVNSAGTNVARRALADLSVEDYRHVVDVNLTGAFLC